MTPGANRSDILLKSRRTAGPGLTLRWFCLGCSQPRDLAGSQGQGVRMRCSACVAAAAAKAGRALP